jgi:DNA-binding MarR family transcriptional regulator
MPEPGAEEDLLISRWVQQMPEIDPLVEGVVERVHLLGRQLEKACTELARPHGLTARDYDLLARLYWVGAPHQLKPSQLAAGTGAPSTTITSRLDRLERLGLICRRPDPQDRRSLLAELTEEGSTKFQGIVAAQAQLERELFGGLTERELRTLRGLLQRAMDACEARLGPPARRVDVALNGGQD